jgi:glycosyltransferase involved in cell wall biosynthesis
MKVAIVSGICVLHDAISNAVVDQASLLSSLPEVESVTVFTQWSDRQITANNVVLLGDPWSLVRHSDVAEADLVIFHWGIAYDLFDALILLDERKTVVHFHNVTPVEFVDPAKSREIERSLAQIGNLAMCSCRVWAVSEFNKQTLRAWGVDELRIRVVPFTIEAPRAIQRPDRAGRVRLLTVGRLVKAKGTDVLLEAIADLVARRGRVVELRLVGNLGLSDADFVRRLRHQMVKTDLNPIVEFVDDPSDDELWAMFEWADVVVCPSLHEGLCVPIIEGYIAGCRAVGTDAGNLPNVVVHPDPVVQASSSSALSRGLEFMVDEISAGRRSPPGEATELVSHFTAVAITVQLRQEFALLQLHR